MDSGFLLLCRASYQLIPTSPWKTMKVIKWSICLFAFLMSFALCLQGRAPSSLLTLQDPISRTDFLIPWRCNEICALSTGDLEIQMPLGSTLSRFSMKLKSHRGLARLRIVLSNGLPVLALTLSPPACIILCQRRANSGCYHGNYISLRWIPSPRLVCNHRAFKSSQPEDLTVAHWEEEFTALQMNLWARERQENREEGSVRDQKKSMR